MTTICQAVPSKDWAYLREARFLPIGLPLLLALIMGLLLAFLIASGYLLLAFAVVFLVPTAILFNRYPLVAIMIWLLVMPFLQPGWVSSQIFWVIHRSLIPLALGIAILSRLLKLKKHPPVQLGRAELAMAAFLVMATVSILLTQRSPLLYLYELYDRTFVPFTAYWLMRLSSPREQDLKRLLPLILAIAVAEIVVGFWAWRAPQSLPWLLAFPRWEDRMSGTFNNPSPYAYVVMFCIMLLFHYAMNCKSRFVRALVMLTLGLGLTCIFFTFTRACWLAALLTLLGLLFLYPKPILSLMLIIMPIMAVLSGDVLAEEFAFANQRLHTEDTAEDRVVLAHAGQQMFYARPFWGWGYASYDLHDWRFMERVGNVAPRKWDIQKGTSHNSYITILAEMGAIGFSFFLFPAIWWLGLTVKVLPRLPRAGFWSRRLLIVLWLSVVFYLVIAQIIDMRFFRYHLGLWWLTLGLIGSVVQTCLKPGDIGAPGWAKRATSKEAHARPS